MARQIGILKVKGLLDELSFYQGKGKKDREALVRRKGGVDGQTIATSPNFARTRENNSEFGRAATNGRLVREALAPMLNDFNNPRLASQLTKEMRSIIALDAVSARGKRKILPAHIARFVGLAFNPGADLRSTFRKVITAAEATGTVTFSIPAYIPITDILAPQGATHFKLKFGVGLLDFDSDEMSGSGFAETNVAAIGGTTQVAQATVAVNIASQLDSGDFILGVVSVAFYQRVNNVDYILQNGSYVPMQVIFAKVAA